MYGIRIADKANGTSPQSLEMIAADGDVDVVTECAAVPPTPSAHTPTASCQLWSTCASNTTASHLTSCARSTHATHLLLADTCRRSDSGASRHKARPVYGATIVNYNNGPAATVDM